jgi:peptide-methionine (S)-S-oxide reductase
MKPEDSEIAVLGGGCFWCLEAAFSHLKGVRSVISGYAGGEKENPTYDEVSGGRTGHAEVIKINFDSFLVSFEDLLYIFFATHDPTTPNRQGNDIGTQYRSIILYTSEEQKIIAGKLVEKLNQENVFENKIVTEIIPLEKFYPAEEYHQEYYKKNSDKAYCNIVINPKLRKLRDKFKKYYQGS